MGAPAGALPPAVFLSKGREGGMRGAEPRRPHHEAMLATHPHRRMIRRHDGPTMAGRKHSLPSCVACLARLGSGGGCDCGSGYGSGGGASWRCPPTHDGAHFAHPAPPPIVHGPSLQAPIALAPSLRKNPPSLAGEKPVLGGDERRGLTTVEKSFQEPGHVVWAFKREAGRELT